METKNILLADFGMNVSHINNQDLIFNVYKGCVNKVKVEEIHFHLDYATADDVDAMGITCTPEVWRRWENNNEAIVSMEVTLNRGFVWSKKWKGHITQRFGAFSLEEAMQKLADAMSEIQFRDDDCKEDWTDIVYIYQKNVYGVEAYITKDNRYEIANEFYGTNVHEDTKMTNYPIRTINNPLEVIPTIEYKVWN
jgi:hypothetical protein